ncbi:3-hydroxyacyl-(acyl-carrier-protein) dehydratase [Cellulophaga algicola DSM 14237]|uniref:3-hydroxyacyl-(Acyl-carrier-protein) dehydratase n=1 Tax=Cellulophaga algicola (strain DSM 14237 / IC166 / ACAM 630) TaxID=688270 RepID=E6XBH7_CELAD|nr:hydroxymyristoyl-ACP dehydratase [Cellulophaga algicola]ADV51090.1 3-hydroxyacyl-(acyl-carrier-protein) dehydratase [Cellulophaga algicola DSM 14237]
MEEKVYNNMEHQIILAQLPYTAPFLFVDGLTAIDTNGVSGFYTFKKEADFYKGHFKNNPITPGVLLTECCAQIGLVCLGIHLITSSDTLRDNALQIALTSSEMEYYLPVYPDEKVSVTSEKIYFRFHKLKCHVKMHNAAGKLVCKGTIAGMLKNKSNE